MSFLLRALSLVLIDLLLAGDNALVIALAVRSLSPHDRRVGTILGAGAAVILRVALTFFAAEILTVPYLQLAGGLFVVWIAVKVLMDVGEPEETAPSAKRLTEAIRYIVVADITMSTDNILAIAGASRGHFALILFGLGVSIPFVVLSANIIAGLMDRFPVLIYVGAAILGRVGGEMMMTDPFVMRTLGPGEIARWAVEGGLAVALFAAGWILFRRREAEEE